MACQTDAIKQLRQQYPRHNVHEGEVYGIPVCMFYTVYSGSDPSCPYPYIEDYMLFTPEGIKAEWVPESEVRHLEDNIFAAYQQRGKRFGGLG